MIVKLAAFAIAKMPKGVLMETTKSLRMEKIAVNILKERKDWWTPILQYLKKDALLTDPKEVKMVIRQSNR